LLPWGLGGGVLEKLRGRTGLLEGRGKAVGFAKGREMRKKMRTRRSPEEQPERTVNNSRKVGEREEQSNQSSVGTHGVRTL